MDYCLSEATSRREVFHLLWDIKIFAFKMGNSMTWNVYCVKYSCVSGKKPMVLWSLIMGHNTKKIVYILVIVV